MARAQRNNLKGAFPCLKCSHGIETDLFECLLPLGSSTYWANKNCGQEEIKCPSCGAKQKIRIFVSMILIRKGSKNQKQCIECSADAVWIRHTQFAGDHPFCKLHAEKETNFRKRNSTEFWEKIKRKKKKQ
ncbi:MAG: hypothetical protein WCW78_00380 [Candidatus Paceibacterota bacterium]|jgi:hypothetical protein